MFSSPVPSLSVSELKFDEAFNISGREDNPCIYCFAKLAMARWTEWDGVQSGCQWDVYQAKFIPDAA